MAQVATSLAKSSLPQSLTLELCEACFDLSHLLTLHHAVPLTTYNLSC
jgi:hypothetical protein